MGLGRTVESGIHLVSLIVNSYDEAIAFFTQKLAFSLVEDSLSFTTSGAPKRWVVVQPPDSPNGFGILLARADGPEQEALVGKQFAGRVGVFWRVKDFEAMYDRLVDNGVELVRRPRTEDYGRVSVFLDLMGNKWDLIGLDRGR